MEPFRFVADGVVSSAPLRRPAGLTTITASRYRARASRPSAPLLWLRDIFLMAQPLLLCEEGEYDAFKFCPSGNIIDIWLRRSGAVVLRTAQSVRQPPFRRPNSSSQPLPRGCLTNSRSAGLCKRSLPHRWCCRRLCTLQAADTNRAAAPCRLDCQSRDTP